MTDQSEIEDSRWLLRVSADGVEVVGGVGPDADRDRLIELTKSCSEVEALLHNDSSLRVDDRFPGLDDRSETVVVEVVRSGGAHILLVDDHRSNREYFEMLLTENGYRVSSCADGAAAEEMARALQPDLMLLDVRLPDVNGYTLCTRLRADPHLTSRPTILHTAHPLSVTNDIELQVGCDRFIVTPVAPNDLLSAIEDLLADSPVVMGPGPIASLELSPKDPLAGLPDEMVRCFGGLSLRGSDGSWGRLDFGRASDLISALIATAPSVVAAPNLAAQLFDGDETKVGAIYTAVSRLRRHLEVDLGVTDLIWASRRGYAVDLSRLSVDIYRFIDGARAIAQAADEDTSIGSIESLLDLWTGTPFERCELASVAELRIRLSDARACLMQHFAALSIADGDNAAAIDALRELLAAEPWREAAWCLQAIALYRSNRQRDSLEVLSGARLSLSQNFGLSPGPEFNRCETALLNQDETLHDTTWVSTLAR